MAPDEESPTSRRLRQHIPYRGYLALEAVFGAAFVGFVALANRSGRPLPERVGAADLALLGVATHKLSQIVARDRVTRPVRAPFTEYTPAKGGKLKERAARGNLRRAIGELLTCPFCVGTWVASALTYSLAVRPRETRLFASIFAAVTVADVCHRLDPRG